MVAQAVTDQAVSRSAYRATVSHSKAIRPVWRARPSAPVTQVPTGKVKAHQVIAKRMPRRRARTAAAPAR